MGIAGGRRRLKRGEARRESGGIGGQRMTKKRMRTNKRSRRKEKDQKEEEKEQCMIHE